MADDGGTPNGWLRDKFVPAEEPSYVHREAVHAEHPAEDAFAAPLEENVLFGAGPTQDSVNLPHHYSRFKIEPVHFISENGLDFLHGNVVKYTLRHDAKNGKEDLKKAIRNLVLIIKRDYAKDPDWWKVDEPLAGYLKGL